MKLDDNYDDFLEEADDAADVKEMSGEGVSSGETPAMNTPVRTRPGRKRRLPGGNYLLKMLGCLVVLVAVMYLGVTLYTELAADSGEKDVLAGAENEKPIYTQTQLEEQIAAAVELAKAEAAQGARQEEAGRLLGTIEEQLAGGKTVVETLRPLYPEDIVIVSNGAFHFIPIREDIPRHNLLRENITVLENGEYQYTENGQVTSHKGIDVSQFQEDIDWQKVAASGVEFAIIRVGYRGYGTGKLMEDTKFADNIQGAINAGVKVGVYFFSQAVSEAEALEEAAFVLERIAPYKLDYPVVFDVEKVADKSGRMNQISVEERTKVTQTFCQAIKQAGYEPMIYHNMEMGSLLIDLGQLQEYDKWFAYYGTELYFPYDFKMWQYSESGKVDGINTAVDMNMAFKRWGE